MHILSCTGQGISLSVLSLLNRRAEYSVEYESKVVILRYP